MDLNTIKSWFKAKAYPTASQFSQTWDSFWHKDSDIPQTSITGLGDALGLKADKEYVDNSIAPISEAAAAAVQTAAAANAAAVAAAGKVVGIKLAIIAEGTVIEFGSDIGNYSISPYCYNSEGAVGFKITARSGAGFTVTPDIDGTFECTITKL